MRLIRGANTWLRLLSPIIPLPGSRQWQVPWARAPRDGGSSIAMHEACVTRGYLPLKNRLRNRDFIYTYPDSSHFFHGVKTKLMLRIQNYERKEKTNKKKLIFHGVVYLPQFMHIINMTHDPWHWCNNNNNEDIHCPVSQRKQGDKSLMLIAPSLRRWTRFK